MYTDLDRGFMTRALELARLGLATTTPNPRVGCVVVRDGRIIGEGHHVRAGEPHAEVHALIAARAAVGADGLAGANCYVTLEPCNHFGRTPPCVAALIEARVARVVAAMEDPDPRVAGHGLAALRHAGIDVRCGLLRAEAESLNAGFVSRMTRGRPWVRLHVASAATAVDAAVARDLAAWKARSCALLTGYGTLLDDDPDLIVAHDAGRLRQPMRVLVDAGLRAPSRARLFDVATPESPVLVFCAEAGGAVAHDLRRRGVEVVACANGAGKVDLAAMLAELGRRGINELQVEAGNGPNGRKLGASLLREALVDELLVYLPAHAARPGRSLSDLPELAALGGDLRLEFESLEPVGAAMRASARIAR